MHDTPPSDPLPAPVQESMDAYDAIAQTISAPEWLKTLYRNMFQHCAMLEHRAKMDEEATH